MPVKIIDDLAPEDVAMLQALYSRSPASMEEHLSKVRERGSGRFMDQYYVGYGHKSIGDCGSTTIFVEGVTMLVAKAIQDWPLYSGQESSTRYIDFSQNTFANPCGDSVGAEIQENWRQFYMGALDPMLDHLRQKYPRQPDEDEKTYERAVQARRFDVLRAFLPAGATTNLSWHTNLRQANDHLRWLCEHPDYAVVDVAEQIQDRLREKYPHSFGHETSAERVDYRNDLMYHDYFTYRHVDVDDEAVGLRAYLNIPYHVLDILADRPRGAEVPWWFAEYGVITSKFQLDFGSFRDLQRHRNGVVRMPLLTMNYGFHEWYLSEMPDWLAKQARELLDRQKRLSAHLSCSPVEMQSYIAMGYKVFCRVTQSLPAFVYRLELRSSKTIHPTLRQVVLEEIREFRSYFPQITLHVDENPDSWTVRRGAQTIEERK